MRISFLSLTMIFAAGLAQPAWADEDEQTYPGLMCRHLVDQDGVVPDPADAGSINISHLAGGITNLSNQVILLFCPIARESHELLSSVEHAKVLIAPSYSGGPGDPGGGDDRPVRSTCTFEIARPVSQQNPESEQPQVSAQGGLTELTFGDGDKNVGSSVFEEYSNLYFECLLSPGETILAYHVTENRGED